MYKTKMEIFWLINKHYQLVEALRYKPGSVSIPDGVSEFFHWHNPVGRTMAPGVDSASNRNEYQEYFLAAAAAGGGGLKTIFTEPV
jgi:hypothetical protein